MEHQSASAWIQSPANASPLHWTPGVWGKKLVESGGCLAMPPAFGGPMKKLLLAQIQLAEKWLAQKWQLKQLDYYELLCQNQMLQLGWNHLLCQTQMEQQYWKKQLLWAFSESQPPISRHAVPGPPQQLP